MLVVYIHSQLFRAGEAIYAYACVPRPSPSKAAEVFACLSATKDPECAALAAQLCSPYLPALEHEYGTEDSHNVAMRAWFKTHCGQCGQAASTCCSRCKRVGYCGAACQEAAWKHHKLGCGNNV